VFVVKNFAEWMEKNREKSYAIAYANSKHDKDGHCLLSKNDPWMKEDCWDRDFEKMKKKGSIGVAEN
jgi:hypothetical protein